MLLASSSAFTRNPPRVSVYAWRGRALRHQARWRTANSAMPSVFISHAHSDKLLARSICALLRDALALNPDDFFTSSEEGRGVSPAANIQQEVLAALASAP